MVDFYRSTNLYLSWGKTGQIALISSPFSGIAQKTIFARHTVEATRGLGMGCWCGESNPDQKLYYFEAINVLKENYKTSNLKRNK